MAELKKQEKLKVAVEIDGSTYLTQEDGILLESVTDNEALLYIKNKEGSKEIKIRIF